MSKEKIKIKNDVQRAFCIDDIKDETIRIGLINLQKKLDITVDEYEEGKQFRFTENKTGRKWRLPYDMLEYYVSIIDGSDHFLITSDDIEVVFVPDDY